MRQRPGVTIATAFVAYTALAVLLTFPLIAHLSSRVPRDLGDPLLSTAILWWNAHVIPLTRRWWDGFAFFSGTGTLAFSDHRLGESLIASPLQWLGASAVTADNITLLASFPLSALAAHGLAFALTKRHDAAMLCGLAYGFNPYRVAHIEHLVLLASFGMPAALAALHLYLDTRRFKWLAGFTLALVLQGLCASYYLLFFSVFLALWMVWFIRRHDWPVLRGILVGCICAALVLSPIIAGYWRIHQAYGLTRGFGDVVFFSADVTSLITASPILAFWGWTAPLNGPERQLFPGLTITAIALTGALLGIRSTRAVRDRFTAPAIGLLLLSCALAAIALSAHLLGPWRLELNGVTLSVDVPFKPLSLAVAALVGAIAFSPQARHAYRHRSPFAFYLLATAAMFVCSFGPKPAFRGSQFLYEPPYAWLMHLPIFANGVRVPSRFAMPAVLALSVAGALGYSRTTSRWKHPAVVFVLAAGIIADGWIGHLPTPTLPEGRSPARASGFEAVMELPFGANEDAAAMYRSTLHQRPVVNGNSGYDPPHYIVLRLAIADRDPTVLDAVASRGPILIGARKHSGLEDGTLTFVTEHPGVTRLGDDDNWQFFRLAPTRVASDGCRGDRLALAAAVDNRGAVDISTLTDNDPLTRWMTPHPQRTGDMLVIDLGHAARPCAIVLSLGPFAELYPRALTVATAVEGARWDTAFSGKTGGLTFRAAVENPKAARIRILLLSVPARFIRLQLTESQERYPWAVTDVVVNGS